MVISPYLKSTEVGERLKDPIIIEEVIKNCKDSFSNLEQYLNIGFTRYYLDKIPPDVLNADKSFTELKYHISKLNCSLEKIDYGNDIENNLEKLQRKVSRYQWLESVPGKVVTYGGIASIAGFIFGRLAYSWFGWGVDGGIIVGIFSAVMSIVAPATESFEKNYITYFIQRSHQSPIENIITHSDLFFTDLREKLKSNE